MQVAPEQRPALAAMAAELGIDIAEVPQPALSGEADLDGQKRELDGLWTLSPESGDNS